MSANVAHQAYTDMGNIHAAGPNEAVVVSGGCFGKRKRKIVVGGYVWAWWCVTDVQFLPLQLLTLEPVSEKVETCEGVAVTVTGVAQCKIITSGDLLSVAAEQFLGKKIREIKATILSTLEGHLRAILGTLTVEQVFKDREAFAALVRDVAAPDVGRMGIEIISFTIKDVFDDVGYLSSLGKARTAIVKRDADIGVAESNRDAGIKEAEAEKAMMDVVYEMNTKIEDNARRYKLNLAMFDKEVNTALAEARLAYELQAAKTRQEIRNEEILIDVVEKKKQIEIEEQEINRKELELNATVRLPAEAECYKVQTIAEANKTQVVETARAQGEKIAVIGSAEAHVIQRIGQSEAEGMRLKAVVYKGYGDAAIKSLVLDSLPKIAAEVTAPLANIEEIVILGGSGKITGEVSRLVAEIPPAVNALTGIDLQRIAKKVAMKQQLYPPTNV